MSTVIDREGLRSVIASLTDLSDGATIWGIDPNPIIGDTDRAQVRLDLQHIRALGVDEHRPHISDGNDGYPAGTYWVEEIGNREVMITITAEAFDKGYEAAEILDLIRTRIREVDVTERLNDLRLAFVWAMDAVRIPATVDERALNRAVADFEFAAIARQVSKVILPGVGGDYIATVNGNNIVPGDLS